MTSIISSVLDQASMNSRWVKSESILSSDNQTVSPPKPGGPLKPRLDAVQEKIKVQISRLERLHGTLRSKDEESFRKLVISIKESNAQYSTVISLDLARVRQVSRVVFLAKITLEKLVAKLSSASDFGDIVIVLSPAMAVVKNLRSSLTPHVFEMEVELGIISELMSGILVDAGQVGGYTINFETANEEAVRLIDEASTEVEQKMKEQFPCIPELPVAPHKLA
jgi:division protein CdvB (Snf7/Vps24/ESCRT-III family)